MIHTKMRLAKEPKVKLTLSVRRSAIEDARKYASDHGTSLSNLIEDYFTSFEKQAGNEIGDTATLADKLFGCARGGPMSSMTDKEIKEMMIKDKYGL